MMQKGDRIDIIMYTTLHLIMEWLENLLRFLKIYKYIEFHSDFIIKKIVFETNQTQI